MNNLCAESSCRTKFNKPISCVKCSPSTYYCSHECLFKHVIAKHQTNEKIKEKYYALKKQNDLESNNNPQDYYYYKNFQIVKIAGQKQIFFKNYYSNILIVKNKFDGYHFSMQIIEKNKLDSVDNILRSIKLHAKCENENICTLFSYSETKEKIYVILEYIEGVSLSNLIKNTEVLNPEDCRSIFAEAVISIHYLHSKNIFHGNVTTDVFFVDNKNKVKLFDFQFSTMKSEALSNSNILIDVFGLGITLFRCFFGFSPLDVRFYIYI